MQCAAQRLTDRAMALLCGTSFLRRQPHQNHSVPTLYSREALDSRRISTNQIFTNGTASHCKDCQTLREGCVVVTSRQLSERGAIGMATTSIKDPHLVVAGQQIWSHAVASDLSTGWPKTQTLSAPKLAEGSYVEKLSSLVRRVPSCNSCILSSHVPRKADPTVLEEVN